MLKKYCDLQVNGYQGVDFSNPALTPEAVFKVAEALHARGTHAFLPTVITSAWEHYTKTLPILADCCETSDILPGIHLEGPFISGEDGAVGTHPKSAVRVPTVEDFRRLQDAARGQVRLLTLAPERPGALALIEYLVSEGVRVSIGHTLANPQQVRDAVSAGATLATHLGNGMPKMLNRTDNIIWSILASDLTVMLITDGIHLPEDFLRVVFRIKGADKIIITSDASPVAGCPPGEYDLWGVRVQVDADERVLNPMTGGFAGSGKDMAGCADYFRQLLQPNDEDFRKTTFSNAAKVAGV